MRGYKSLFNITANSLIIKIYIIIKKFRENLNFFMLFILLITDEPVNR